MRSGRYRAFRPKKGNARAGLLHGTTASVTDDEIVPNIKIIRLDRLERVDGRGLGLADHLDLGLGAHAGPLGGLERGVLGGVGPDGRAGEDELDLGGGHEGLAVPAGEGVHGVPVDLREVVADGVDDVLVELLELRGRLLRADVERQLLRPVQEQLDAPQPRLLGLELEAPFRRRLGPPRRVGRVVVRDLRRHLVRRDAVPARPRLYYLDVIRRRRVDGRYPIVGLVSPLFSPISVCLLACRWLNCITTV